MHQALIVLSIISLTVKKISVEGYIRISPEMIINSISLKEGEEIDYLKIRKDVEHLFSLGYFSDIKVIEKPYADGAEIIFIVKERPIISSVKIEGRDEISEEKLTPKIFIKQGKFFKPMQLKKQEKDIEKLYKEEGFYLVKVTSYVEFDEANRASIVIYIKEGDKIRNEKIWIAGAKKLDEKKVKESLSMKEPDIASYITDDDKFDLESSVRDRERVLDSYYDWGYLDVKSEKSVSMLIPEIGRTHIFHKVEEGKRYKVGSIDVSGNILFRKEQMIQFLDLKRDRFFSRRVLLSDVFWLTELYSDIGFADANVEPIIDKHPSHPKSETGTVDITFDISKGKLWYFGEIGMINNTKTRDRIIRRKLDIAEGEVYSLSKIEKGRRELYSTGFFEEVKVAPKRTFSKKINLNVEVKEGRTGTLSAGAGIAPTTPVQGFATLQSSFLNFLGYGQRLSLSLYFGGRNLVFFNFDFLDEQFLDTSAVLSLSAYNRRINLGTFILGGGGGTFGIGYFIADKVKLLGEIGGKDETAFYIDGSNPPFIKGSKSIYTGLNVTRDTRDHYLDPTDGTLSTLYSRITVPGSEIKYLKSGMKLSYFHRVVWQLVFSQSAKFDLGLGLDGKHLSYTERFFVGGWDTIRGYDFYSIGPDITYQQDSELKTMKFGGNKSVIFNTEFIFPIIKPAGLKGVLFFDVGGVFSEGQNIFSDSIKAGYGFEIRWFTPFAPFRFIFGFPVEKRSSLRFDFALGFFPYI